MYQEKNFDLPSKFEGDLSKLAIDEHLKLYQGYVKHTNYILDKIAELWKKDREANKYEIGELRRRLGFEFDGMRNHEYYFSALEKGSQNLPEKSLLKKAIEKRWGSFSDWLVDFKQTAVTRGVGWAILYFDPSADLLLNVWVDEHQLGHLTGLQPILTLDVWEHAFVYDYQPSGKGQYVDDFFANVNWRVIEENYNRVVK